MIFLLIGVINVKNDLWGISHEAAATQKQQSLMFVLDLFSPHEISYIWFENVIEDRDDLEAFCKSFLMTQYLEKYIF